MGFNFNNLNPQKIFNDIKGQLDNFGNQIKYGVTSVGNEMLKKIKNTGGDIEREIKRVGSDVEDQAKKTFYGLQNEVNSNLQRVKSEVESSANRIKDETLHVIDEAKKVPKKLLHEIEKEVIRTAFKTAIDRALKVSRLLPNQIDFSVQAVVGIEFTFDVGDDISKLVEWSEKPPASKSEILEFIKDVAPDSIKIFASGGVALGFEFDVSAGATWNKDYLIEHWDEIEKIFS